jgi:isohexenylglutaconyl-CoA hydratase
MAQALVHTPAELVGLAARVFSQAAQSPEGQEGALAFLQKRKPAWATTPVSV